MGLVSRRGALHYNNLSLLPHFVQTELQQINFIYTEDKDTCRIIYLLCIACCRFSVLCL